MTKVDGNLWRTINQARIEQKNQELQEAREKIEAHAGLAAQRGTNLEDLLVKSGALAGGNPVLFEDLIATRASNAESSGLNIDPKWLPVVENLGYKIDVSAFSGIDLTTLDGPQLDALVQALDAAMEQNGYDQLANEGIKTALASLIETLGLRTNAEGVLLAVALTKLDELEAAAAEEAAADLAVQDNYIEELNDYLDALLNAESHILEQGGGKAQTTVEFQSVAIEGSEVGVDAETPRLANLATVREEITAIRAQVAQAKSDREGIAAIGSAAAQWENKTTQVANLTRALTGEGALGAELEGFVHTKQEGPECGPTSLSMILAYFGVNATPKEIIEDYISVADDVFRGTTSESLVDAAEGYGMEANRVNHGTTDQLIACIDSGIPLIAQGTWDGGERHYLVVTGYKLNDAGEVSEWIVMDPAKNTGPTTMTASAFERFWSNDASSGLCGMENFFIALAPEGSALADSLPPEELGPGAGEMALNEGLVQVIYGLRDLVWPFDEDGNFIGVREWLRNAFIDGIFEVEGGLLMAGSGAVAWVFEELGELCGGDVGEFLGGVGETIANLGYNLEDISTSIGDTLGNTFDELLDGDIGGAVEAAVEGTVDTVENIIETGSDLLEDIGDAIGCIHASCVHVSCVSCVHVSGW